MCHKSKRMAIKAIECYVDRRLDRKKNGTDRQSESDVGAKISRKIIGRTLIGRRQLLDTKIVRLENRSIRNIALLTVFVIKKSKLCLSNVLTQFLI